MEAGGLKSRGPQGHTPSETSRILLGLFLTSDVARILGIPWLGDASLQYPPPSSRGILPMHLSALFLLRRTPVPYGSEGLPYSNYDLILTDSTHKDPISK